MKGIPIVFRGFFRSLDASISLNLIQDQNGIDIPASWKIIERNNPSRYVNFKNKGGNTSSISFRSVVGKERLIQFYYNPDKITSILIPSAAISTLPEVKFANCLSFNFRSNRLTLFPNLVDTTPILRDLDLSGNQFYYSEVAAERRLVAAVMSKIPTTVRSLYLNYAFRGSIDPHVIADRLPDLEALQLAGHGLDDNNPTAPFPSVGVKVRNYEVNNNDFRTIIKDTGNDRYSFEDLPDLEYLNIGSNYYTSGTPNIISDKLSTAIFYNVGFTIPNMPNARTSLVTFNGVYMRSAGSLFNTGGNYVFENFSALTSISFHRAGLGGAMPEFTNVSLTSIDLTQTSIVGGTYSGNTTFVIPANTFSSTPELTTISISSASLLTSPIHPDALASVPKLSYLYYYSYGRTSGSVPNLGNCSNLEYIYLSHNAFTGNLPVLNSLNNLYAVYLNHNNFSGTVPVYKNLARLRTLYIHNNQLTTLPRFSNLPSLEYFYAHNNAISGIIPSFGDCPNLYYLILYNNKFETYTPGSFTTLYRINYLDLSGNDLTQDAVDQILSDLLDNYNAVNRGRVTVNLRGNSIPSENGQEDAEILRSKGWTITISNT